MKHLSETFLVTEALLEITAPDFPLMRQEWADEDAFLDWYENFYAAESDYEDYIYDEVLS
jgi:hypothetical protein